MVAENKLRSYWREDGFLAMYTQVVTLHFLRRLKGVGEKGRGNIPCSTFELTYLEYRQYTYISNAETYNFVSVILTPVS